MTDIKRYRYQSPPPSREDLEKAGRVIENNLAEIKNINEEVNRRKKLLTGADSHQLFSTGCLLFDFYLHAEDSLLVTARTIDKWIPGSLDWHERLLKLMQTPRPEKRPPLISGETASLLYDYMILYLNLHRQGSNLNPERIKKLVDNLDHLYHLLEKDLTSITRLFIPNR